MVEAALLAEVSALVLVISLDAEVCSELTVLSLSNEVVSIDVAPVDEASDKVSELKPVDGIVGCDVDA